MRISDWSSDVCSSDLRSILSLKDEHGRLTFFGEREARGTLRAIVYTGFAADGAGASVATMYEDYSAMRAIARILGPLDFAARPPLERSEEHTSELQSLMRI